MSDSDADTRSPARRKGDVYDSIHFRAHRIHRINGNWYFLTREGGNVEPFAIREEMETCLSIFLKRPKS